MIWFAGAVDVLAARIAEAEKETALAEKRAATASKSAVSRRLSERSYLTSHYLFAQPDKTSKKYMRDLETELRAVEADQKVDFLLKKLTTVVGGCANESMASFPQPVFYGSTKYLMSLYRS